MSEKVFQVFGAVLLAGAVSAIIMLVQKHKAREGWAGYVTRIRRYSTEDAEGAGAEYVSVSYMRDDGKPGSLELSSSSYPFFFNGLEAGDRLVKRPGEAMPKRVGSDSRPPAL